MNGLIYAALLLNATDATLERDWDRAALTLKLIPATPSTYEQLEYLNACVSHALGDGKRAALHCARVLDGIGKAERRHEVICEIILRDIATWKDGDLGDIDRDMRRAADALQSGRRPTKIHEDIIRKLDKLIEEQEDEQKKAAQTQHEQTDKPAEIPQIGGPTGKGQITEKELKQIAQNWGTMPDKQREQVVQQISRDVPEKYKQMVESYLKSLGR